jgi:hypothetical protein
MQSRLLSLGSLNLNRKLFSELFSDRRQFYKKPNTARLRTVKCQGTEIKRIIIYCVLKTSFQDYVPSTEFCLKLGQLRKRKYLVIKVRNVKIVAVVSTAVVYM